MAAAPRTHFVRSMSSCTSATLIAPVASLLLTATTIAASCKRDHAGAIDARKETTEALPPRRWRRRGRCEMRRLIRNRQRRRDAPRAARPPRRCGAQRPPLRASPGRKHQSQKERPASPCNSAASMAAACLPLRRPAWESHADGGRRGRVSAAEGRPEYSYSTEQRGKGKAGGAIARRPRVAAAAAVRRSLREANRHAARRRHRPREIVSPERPTQR